MLFILRLLKALRLKSKLTKYIKTRKFTIEEEEWEHNWFNRFLHWLKRKFPFLSRDEPPVETISYNRLDKFKITLFTDGTFANYVLKSVVGFLSGILLTYVFFIFFILQLNFPLGTATTMCSIFGLVLTLGLAYSYRVRCIVFMLLPQFFSKRGRQALVAYAFILALTGPAKNTLNNMRVLSETMACGQGKLKSAVKNLMDIVKKPFYAIKDSLKHVMEKIKEVIEKVKEIINTLKRIIKSIIGVIKSAYEWLNSIVSMCSKKTGTPFQRCEKAFQQAYHDCMENVPSLFDDLCKVTDFVQSVCIIVKPIDYVCELFDFVSDEIVNFVKKKLTEFTSQVKSIFYVSIKFSHNFEFHTEQSKTIKEIAAGIMMEIKQRTDKIFYFFNWMSFVFSFFFLYMLIQVLNYKRKYMSNEWFDNHFITENIVHLDIQRTHKGLETILPLNIHEKKKYVQVSSIRLVANEKKALAKSAIFLGLSTIKLSIHMLTDYSLWWVLKMIRYHGQFQTDVDTPGSIQVVVDGEGMLADMYSSILNSFQPTGVKFDLDTSPCLPDPVPPDLPRYRQIASLIIVAWILSICEPYGLRLRNTAMGYYYPARARVRAVWLYNHILRSRGSFFKYARRQLRRMFLKNGEGVEKISFMDRLRAVCPFLRIIWKGKDLEACLLCGGLGTSSSPLVKCPRPDCVGIYCVSCYGQLQNLCTLCKLPIEYGDLSDISEERDSSDEDIISAPAKSSEETSIGDSDTTAALLQDTAESEASYSYQFKDRDINESRLEIRSTLKDSELQESRISKATLEDYAFPIEHHPEEEEHKMTLAQRKRSGMWSLISDENKPKLIHLNDEESIHESKIGSLIESGSQENLFTTEKTTNVLHATQQIYKNKYILENHIEAEISESEMSDYLDPIISSELKKYKMKKEMRKHSHLSKFKRIYQKGNKQTQAYPNEKEYDLRKPLLSFPEIMISGRNELGKFDTEIDQTKSVYRMENEENFSFHKSKSGKKCDSIDEGEKVSLDTKTSVESKSSQMIKNWIRTGSYHYSNELQKIPEPDSKMHPVCSNKLEQVATGIKNLFKHISPNKELESIAIHKSSADSKSNQNKIQLKLEREKNESPNFRFWHFWKKDRSVNEQTEDSEMFSKSATSNDINPPKRNIVLVNKMEQASMNMISDESFVTMKKIQTPAKIVYERFKIDDCNL